MTGEGAPTSMTIAGVYQSVPIDRIIYGRPATAVLAEEAARLGASRVFLMVSRTLDRDTDWVSGMRTALGARYAGSYDGMPSHTPREAVLNATLQARALNADLIVTFGGGSLTDAGKMVRLALRHDIARIEDFDRFAIQVTPEGRRIAPAYDGPTVDQIAIPTTLSAGDFNAMAGATDTRTALKEIYHHPRLVPRVIVLDPAVTLRTPQWLWLSTGVRALDHAVESLCAPNADVRASVESLAAIRLLARALPRTFTDPADLGARLDAQLAMWMSMEHHRFGVSKGASHGIGHVLGGTCDVPHGYTSCVMLPAVMRYNEAFNPTQQAAVAEALGHSGRPAWEVLDEFITGLDMPRTLRAVGVTAEQFSAIAQAALLDHYLHTNPRPIKNVDGIMTILSMAA